MTLCGLAQAKPHDKVSMTWLLPQLKCMDTSPSKVDVFMCRLQQASPWTTYGSYIVPRSPDGRSAEIKGTALRPHLERHQRLRLSSTTCPGIHSKR